MHAVGNLISLKLIVEDDDIVERINKHLPSQIRVWGIERTTGGFSSYRLCDSRMYEYMIPTHVFLPPHPKSVLGRKLLELAQEEGDMEGWKERQKEVWDFWAKAEEEHIKPVIESLDPSIREIAFSKFLQDPDALPEDEPGPESTVPTAPVEPPSSSSTTLLPSRAHHRLLQTAFRQLKAAYHRARLAYRIDATRLQRIRDILQLYTGTHNFHNYTINKDARDSSAKRHIKTFTAGEPELLGESASSAEWLSLRVHGQSFMMHQIRKMVFMAAFVVRTGTDPKRIEESYGHTRLPIPKAPSQGLLLVRPVFDTYNAGVAEKFQRQPLDFDRHKAEMDAFRQKEIIERMWREEEKEHQFVTHSE